MIYCRNCAENIFLCPKCGDGACFSDLEKAVDKAGDKLTFMYAREKVLVEALFFYGYTAIHNPNSDNKSEQYWNDVGIHDHGARARTALAKLQAAEGGDL